MARTKVERNISYDDTKKLYYVCMNFGKNPETGKQDKVYKTFEKVSEARTALDLHEAERKAAKLKEKEYRAPQKVTVRQAIKQYFELEKTGKKKLEKSTEYGYRIVFDKHFVPFCSIIGKSYAKDFNRKDFQRYFIWLEETQGLSQNSISKHYSLLKSLFYMLQKDGVCEINPLMLVDKPKRETPKKNVYTPEEAAELIKVFKGDSVELAVLMGLYMGLRREEIAGLKWENVNLDESYIDIVSARVQVDWAVIEKGPKTESSERSLYLPPRVETLLLSLKTQQAKDKKDFGAAYNDSGYVLVWPDGRPYYPQYLYDHFKRVLKKSELRHVTLHDLRKTFASLACKDSGYDMPVKQALGHHPQGVTEEHYIYVYDTYSKEVIERVEAIYESALLGKKQKPKKVVNGRA